MRPPLRIGIDLGGTKVEAVSFTGTHEGPRHRRLTPRHDYAQTLSVIADLVQAIEQEQQTRGTVGLGIPGAISPATGRVKNANSTWLNDKPFKQDLEATLGRPVRIANDADCFALSEATDGAGAAAPSMFGLILGTGVGGGIVINGQLLMGNNAIAGEWGHNPLPWPAREEIDSPRCYCGRNGCLETWISGPGFAADHARHTGASTIPTPAEIVASARQGDKNAVASLARYTDRLARGLAMVINILDPHVIVIGGGMSNVEEIYAPTVDRLATYVFSDRVDTAIRRNRHGDSSGVRGAAWLWSETEAMRGEWP